MIIKNDVVQFNEAHKWVGCFGFVNEVKPGRIMVEVPMPQQGIAYIFCKESDLERIGPAALITKEED